MARKTWQQKQKMRLDNDGCAFKVTEEVYHEMLISTCIHFFLRQTETKTTAHVGQLKDYLLKSIHLIIFIFLTPFFLFIEIMPMATNCFGLFPD